MKEEILEFQIRHDLSAQDSNINFLNLPPFSDSNVTDALSQPGGTVARFGPTLF
jgi:hypothetical protein